nr:hypothetical protein [Leptospira koniambonensis]
MRSLKNFLIGRKFRLENSSGCLRLNIKDRGLDKYFYLIVYATLSAYAFYAFSNLGVFISVIVFVVISKLLYHSYSPFRKERFIQIDEDGITLSKDMTFTSFVGTLKWGSIRKVEKIKYYRRIQKAYVDIGPFYKFTLKYNKEIEVYCIFPKYFEEEFIKAFRERKITFSSEMVYLEPTIIA